MPSLYFLMFILIIIYLTVSYQDNSAFCIFILYYVTVTLKEYYAHRVLVKQYFYEKQEVLTNSYIKLKTLAQL